MKIIKRGDAAWPLTVENHCISCGTVYKLEPGDHFNRHGEGGYSDRITSPCPVCKATVTTANPNASWTQTMRKVAGGLSGWSPSNPIPDDTVSYG